MCGRFNQMLTTAELKKVGAEIGASAILPPPNYNVSPTQPVIAIAGANPRMADSYGWGLIPFWAKDRKIQSRTFNARGETVSSKPAFRAAFRERRCIIPADGFYEWKRTDDGKQPYYIYRSDNDLMGFAGLWETWRMPGKDRSESFRTCTVITTDASAPMSDLHARMPVILERDDWDIWLNPDGGDVTELQALLRPASDDVLVWHPVNPAVGNSRNNGRQLIEPYSSR